MSSFDSIEIGERGIMIKVEMKEIKRQILLEIRRKLDKE